MKTLTLEQILEIVDPLGFDWWGFKDKFCFSYDADICDTINIHYVISDGDEFDEYVSKSLADLFTNNSFLEALVKIMAKKDKYYKGFIAGFSDAEISLKKKHYVILKRNLIQLRLIESVTEKDGKHCEIITKFIGENK